MIFKSKLLNRFCGIFIGSSLAFPAILQAQSSEELSAAANAGVNTKYNEIKPLQTPDGKSLFFTRSNHPLNAGGKKDKGDVWKTAVLADGSWAAPQLASSVFNSSQLNMVIGFSADGQDVYFQTYDPETKGKRQSGIFKMPLSGGSAKPVTIHYFFNGAKYQDATVSPDGKTMFLAMESYSTYGLEDLYVSFLQPDGNWSEPKNLGQDINTEKQEMAAWLSPDGETLYFSSNGHGGKGSVDIFRSTRLDNSWKSWSKPVNLGADVNSAGADIYYSENFGGKWALYSTTKNSEGYGDITKIPIPENQPEKKENDLPIIADQAPIYELVKEDSSAEEIKAMTVVVRQSFDLKGSLLNENAAPQSAQLIISNANSDFRKESATSGAFDLSLPEAGEYQLKVQSKGYYPIDTALTVAEGVNNLNLRLKPIKVGETVLLQDVMFRQSTAVLLEPSNNALDKVVELMKENPQMEILLTGHTDNQGNSKANIRLSRERVEAVKNYMISRGIEEERVQGKGFGGTRPVASNANEESRKLNRRVEFTIIKK